MKKTKNRTKTDSLFFGIHKVHLDDLSQFITDFLEKGFRNIFLDLNFEKPLCKNGIATVFVSTKEKIVIS
jgi:hypothetical protein